MPPLIFRHVSKSFSRKKEVGASKGSFRHRQVLSDVSLEVGEGDIACVLGKNGSGKTTLVRIASALIEQDQGEVRICGYDTVRESAIVKSRVGVILNAGEGGFHFRLSGFSNLEYHAALYKIRRKEARTRIRLLLTELGLEDRGADQYQSYSSGMKRRLALAKALLPDAPVLLLDEPTLGVDPWSAEQIHTHLSRLSKMGKTILCTTNSLSEARRLSEKVHVIENGSLSVFPRAQEVTVS